MKKKKTLHKIRLIVVEMKENDGNQMGNERMKLLRNSKRMNGTKKKNKQWAKTTAIKSGRNT